MSDDRPTVHFINPDAWATLPPEDDAITQIIRGAPVYLIEPKGPHKVGDIITIHGPFTQETQ